jgi:molybdopterin molybdotransferase
MISVDEAFSILNNLTFPLKEMEVSLWDARNHVLSETVISPINMPPFRQSNMDGFALALHDDLAYEIIGEIKAGDTEQISLEPGQAVKIFTGAAVPDSAKAVIQIEKVLINGNQLMLQENVSPELNVRALGSQIMKDAEALKKGISLNPAAIGFLAGLGFTSVKVYQKPAIGIVITGNELVQPGQPLPYGKVYESNAIMLLAALHHSHYEKVSLYEVKDDFESTKNILQKAVAENDVILVSGGISVGDYDFTGKALESLGVETLFYKVSQKPGKPLYAGKLKEKIIFALPGNPAAALTCFYVHVRPMLHRVSGMEATFKSNITKKLTLNVEVNNPRDQFLKAVISTDEVTLLPHQDSSMLDSFALANGLVYLPAGNYRKDKGENVTVYLI